jgi:hypothetical protein
MSFVAFRGASMLSVPKIRLYQHSKKQIQAFLIVIRESVQDPDRKATGQNLKPGDRAALTFHGTRHAFAQGLYRS